MTPESSRPEINPAQSIYVLYRSLGATKPLTADFGLGGRLLYAGVIGLAEENSPGRQLLFASNIAGAASLAASADPSAQRQAIRDGAVDFMVTSLEEALRILKNEVRKRQAVSVGIAADPRRVVEAMLERGVLPDLLPPVSWPELASGLFQSQAEQFTALGAQPLLPAESPSENYVTWSVDRDFARWLPRLDACVRSVVPAGDIARQRWLRLAPRYLGRMVQRQHGVALTANELLTVSSLFREALLNPASGCCEPVQVAIDGVPLTA